MQRKIPLKWSVFVVSVVGILFSIIIIFFLVPDLPAQGSFTPSSPQVSLSADQADSGFPPTRLKIPSINVDAAIESVGLTTDGAMDVPKQPDDVAWYNLGIRPGGLGSAVIDGHSGYKNNRPAVFDNLYKLSKGDKIYVEDGKGVMTTFVVREIRKYNPNADAADVFSSNDDQAHLNLITCTGFWNKIWKSHSERLVVFTDKEI